MKQEEKAENSKKRIVTAAIKEFGTKSYDAASLNNICNDNKISKGLIYHYFNNKDGLYLLCVKLCLEKFMAFLAEKTYDFSDFKSGMNQYLARRFLFFQTHPLEGRLFFYTILQPPKKLKKQLKELRSDFDKQSLGYYKEALGHISLKDGITENDALEYFSMFQEVFNSYWQKHVDDTLDFDSLMKIHESKIINMLNLMLYGIAKEDK